MEILDALELLRDAVGEGAGVWADLGAGGGTFTRALGALLGTGSTIYAVDDDATAVHALETLPRTPNARVVAVKADFARPVELSLPGLGDAALDGILFANSLHFVRDAQGVLTRLAERLRPGGRVVVIEYDRREASRWVPYPIPAARWPTLAGASGLIGAKITATRPSAYQGVLYAGCATKP